MLCLFTLVILTILHNGTPHAPVGESGPLQGQPTWGDQRPQHLPQLPYDHLLLSMKLEAPLLAAARRLPAWKPPHHLPQHLATGSRHQAGDRGL